jgi:hypothetical protein
VTGEWQEPNRAKTAGRRWKDGNGTDGAPWTRVGAFASFQEQSRGSLEAGKQADFLVLSADPTKTDAEKIRGITVEKVIAGKVVAGANPF